MTTSVLRIDVASKRSWSLRWRGINGWFGVVDWSGSSQTAAPMVVDGMLRW